MVPIPTPRRAREIFEQALGIEEDSPRHAYVALECASDEPLRLRVEQLLLAAGPAGCLLPDNPETPSMPTPSEVPGQVIGRYKLLEKLGEGGMGVVYIAEQEEPVRRRVALKVIKLGMDTKQVVARFEAERQALALMDHPNIARVLDGGATDTGRPYFVMELVLGVPITEFCDANKLSTIDRLKLFTPVCQAIQSAHQKGIIHRDLKPSNVLVTLNGGVPHPMVIDFGVAKATNQKLTEKTLVTNIVTMIGTPAYMSPEQAEMSKLDVDTRSDIYSLGVLLYELLVGTTPFPEARLRSVGYGEMQRIIAEEEPERPSTRLRKTTSAADASAPQNSTLRTPHSTIDPDLDWIVMKCLEKDRARRYETANGLVADIQRHLNNEPVTARPPSASYRFQKFVRRNKLQFAVGAFAAAALVVALAVSSWQAIRVTHAHIEAVKQAEIARSVKDFLAAQVLGSANPFVETVYDPNRRSVLDRVARQLEGKFTNQPEIEAEIRFALADAFDGLDDYELAAAQLERALAIRERLLGWENSETLRTATKLSAAYSNLPQRKTEAERLALQAVAAARRASKTLSAAGAEALSQLAYEYSQTGRPAEALTNATEAVEALRRTLDAKDIRISVAMWTVPVAIERLGHQTEAERLWDEGIRHCQRAHGTNHPMVSAFLKGKANFLRRLGRPVDAVPLLQQAIAVQERTLGRNHPWTLDSLSCLATAYEEQHFTDRAADCFAVLGRDASSALYSLRARSFYSESVSFLVRHQRFREARAIFKRGRSFILENKLEQTWAFEALVAATAALDGWRAAADVCRANMDRFPDAPLLWLNKAWIFRYVGEEEGYQQVVATVLALASQFAAKDQHVPIEIAAMGPCRFSAEQGQQLDSLMRALYIALPSRLTDQQTCGYRALGQMHLRLGQFEESLAALEKSEAKSPGPDPFNFFIRALCEHRLGHDEKARAAFEEGEALIKPLLTESLEQTEPFLPTYQLYQRLLTYREAKSETDTAGPKP